MSGEKDRAVVLWETAEALIPDGGRLESAIRGGQYHTEASWPGGYVGRVAPTYTECMEALIEALRDMTAVTHG